MLCTTSFRPRLKYGGPALFPCSLIEMGKTERVQCYAVRLIDGLRGIDCKVRLRILHLFPMRYQRLGLFVADYPW